MPQWQAIIPLSGVCLNAGQRVEFADGLTLDAMPNWVSKDPWLDWLYIHDREAIRRATHAFIATYSTEMIDSPIRTWKHAAPKPALNVWRDSAILANVAIWLSRPSPMRIIHALYADVTDSDPRIKRSVPCQQIFHHPKDSDHSPSAEDIALAQRLYLSVTQLEKKGSVWNALQATVTALQQGIDIIRYFLFWVALEALFGDRSELRYRLSQRIAFFIAKDRSEAREIYEKAKDGYDFRSQIAHGGWSQNKESVALLADVETHARESLMRVLLNNDLLKTFSGKNERRNAYLDGLVFKEFGVADQE